MNFIRKSWTKETCYPGSRDKWDEKLPETGQCAITSLLVQDLLGGHIVKNEELHHYFNYLDRGTFDLTKWQFDGASFLDFNFDKFVPREELLKNEDTKERYLKLKENLIKQLNANGETRS